MSTPKSLLVAAAPLLLLLGACGGSDKPASAGAAGAAGGTLDAAFAQRAEAVCAPYARYNAGHLLGVRGFSRYAPDPDQLPRVGAYLARNPAYRTLAADLEELGEPASGADSWHTVLGDVRADSALVQRLTRAARAADDTAFAATADQVAAAVTALHVDLRALGLPAGSSCAEVQDDPLRTSTSMH
jgi:hypothetical protein